MPVQMKMSMWDERLGLFDPGDDIYSFPTMTEALRFVRTAMAHVSPLQHTRLDLSVTADGEIGLSIMVPSSKFAGGMMVDRVFFIRENA